jgi:hypothetical protein
LTKHETQDVVVELLEKDVVEFVVFIATIDLNLLEGDEDAGAEVSPTVVFSNEILLD